MLVHLKKLTALTGLCDLTKNLLLLTASFEVKYEKMFRVERYLLSKTLQVTVYQMPHRWKQSVSLHTRTSLYASDEQTAAVQLQRDTSFIIQLKCAQTVDKSNINTTKKIMQLQQNSDTCISNNIKIIKIDKQTAPYVAGK